MSTAASPTAKKPRPKLKPQGSPGERMRRKAKRATRKACSPESLLFLVRLRETLR